MVMYLLAISPLCMVSSGAGPNSYLPLIICFWLCWVSGGGQTFSAVAEGGGCPSCHVQTLTAAASLVEEQGLQGACASVVVAQGLSCSKTCGVFPDQGSNLCPQHWQTDSLPRSHLGKSPNLILY